MEQIKWSAGSFYAGGSDTTVAFVYPFFMLMVLYPQAQLKAQQEIDDVIGRDRLPTLADRGQLPYCPLGLPHRSRADDVHNGYFIPAGSIIMVNVWKLLHDSNIYKDPFTFMPERFPGATPERDPKDFAFGFGRRICPGIHLAEATVWINVVMSLAAFSMNHAKDTQGKPIEIKPEFNDGIIRHPKRFECDVQPRHENIPLLVQQATA